MVAAPGFEEAHMEPVILDVAAPRVVMGPRGVGPSGNHGVSRSTHAVLESGRDCTKSFGFQPPPFHAPVLGPERGRRFLEDARRLGIRVDTSIALDEMGANRR